MPAPKRNYSEKYLSGEEFSAWLKTRKLTLTDAAIFFGVTKNSIRHLVETGVSKRDALAISAVERGLEPWRPSEAELQQAKDMKILTVAEAKEEE